MSRRTRRIARQAQQAAAASVALGANPSTVVVPRVDAPALAPARNPDALIAPAPSVDKFPVVIGSSLKFCLIAEGVADLYPRFGPTCEWDIGAGHAVVRAAGGADLLVPLVADAVRSVDIDERVIDVDLRFLGEAG